MGSIELRAVEKWFGDVQVIKGIDLAIGDGEFVIFVGPSGCGKSTLLRMIAGLEETSRGQVLIDGRDATSEPPARRGLAMVFQSYALYPHMSVRENMGFALKTAGAPRALIEAKVNEAARVLKLEDYLDRRPKALSGGQRQRVAIGRSIVRDPTAFLFDEPLSNLDAALRVEMRYEIAKLHQALKSTMIYVTHDQIEAMTLADRIVVLDGGTIAQVGTPRELYQRPANLFVAGFIGSPKMNILACETGDGRWRLAGAGAGDAAGVAGAAGAGDAAPTKGGAFSGDRPATRLGIRPEHLRLAEAGQGQCQGRVDIVEYLGSDTFVIVECPGIGSLTLRLGGDSDLVPGAPVGLSFPPEALHFFDAQGLAIGR